MTLAERYAKLEPRERKLLTGLGVALISILVVFLPALLYQSVAQARNQNQEVRDYLKTVSERRAKIDKDKAQRAQHQARYEKTMPPLATFVEDAAKANSITIEESSPKPDVPHGKKYVEHVLSVKLRKVGLLGLVRTLEKIEKSNYPVAVTRLNIKPRSNEPDTYDVDAFISHFESKDVKKEKPAAKDAEDQEEE